MVECPIIQLDLQNIFEFKIGTIHLLHTANFLVAKIATISCVFFPVAIWLRFLQLLVEANSNCKYCNQKLKLPLVTIFATNSCSYFGLSLLQPIVAVTIVYCFFNQ